MVGVSYSIHARPSGYGIGGYYNVLGGEGSLLAPVRIWDIFKVEMGRDGRVRFVRADSVRRKRIRRVTFTSRGYVLLEFRDGGYDYFRGGIAHGHSACPRCGQLDMEVSRQRKRRGKVFGEPYVEILLEGKCNLCNTPYSTKIVLYEDHDKI